MKEIIGKISFIKRMRKQDIDWEKQFAKNASDKGAIQNKQRTLKTQQ